MNKLLASTARQLLLHRESAGSIAAELRISGGVLSRRFSTTANDDTHDDFKPKIKGPPPPSVAEQIESDVKSAAAFVYMKGVPQAPMCGFSQMACRILDVYEVEYGSRNVLADPDIREGIKKYTHWPTIPQIFIGGEFVGGSDILMQMHQSGELKAALEKAAAAGAED